MPYCSVVLCNNNGWTKNLKYEGVSYHRFPKDERVKEKWTKTTGRDNWVPAKSSTICSDHFLEDDFIISNKGFRYIKPTAVPSVKIVKSSNQPKNVNVVTASSSKKQCDSESPDGFFSSVGLICGDDDAMQKGSKAVQELDRFKRRLIHSVAHLMLRDKKPEKEVWETLKRDTGCNCKLLWSRMRALTLKKLERHFIAEDRIDRVPSSARMTFTDWLMVDLVLVHQDLDFIGQELNLNENFLPLEELFDLVNLFGIEGLKGEDLAEAWSSATLNYNKNGHQCSPMLLQKRWYQMKAVTRSKFYNFWYSYKGCVKKLHLAEPYTPTSLEHAIARRYKELITSPHLSWEELIEQRLVALPEEFERQMMERAGFDMQARRQSYEDASDLELVEPRIETIDLRQESDENPPSESNDETLPQIVRIKQEPPDPDLEPELQVELPKNSIYHEVLQSTLKENLEIDAMLTKGDFDNYNYGEDNEVEKIDPEASKDETMMPQITCVFSNVSEGNLDNFSGTDKNALPKPNEINSDAAKLDDKPTVTPEDDVQAVTDDNQTPTVVDGQTLAVDGEDALFQVEGVISVIVNSDGDNVVVQGNDSAEEDELTRVEVNDEAKVPVSVEENAQKEDGNVCEEIQAVNSVAQVNTEDNIINLDSTLEDKPVQNKNVNLKDSEVIDDTGNTTNPVIITDSEDEPHSDPVLDAIDTTYEGSPKLIGLAIETAENIQTDDVETVPDDVDTVPDDVETVPDDVETIPNDVVTVDEDKDIKPDVKLDTLKFTFGELSRDLSFVDDGIELADDGIAFDDYDDHVEIKTEPDEPEEPKIDQKLLMVPVVYTTRLDDLDIFRILPYDHIRNKDILDAVINRNKPIKQEKTNDNIAEDIVEDTPMTLADEDTPVTPAVADVKCEPMSTDEDSNDSVVPENMKVKPTSYLLQKPRSRSYNTIQLCKNPDFNTRLKRLNVGFFKSPRNRALIKHCKPLTIDISKAFETKLVNGTLYLKPGETSDNTIKNIKIDDSEIIQNATVVPSAMIAQSLINNTETTDILPLILEANAPEPVEHERNTRINLPDITEIRRINQRLLTAEISPIQIQNKTFQAPVTLISNQRPAESPAVITPTLNIPDLQTDASDNSSCQQVDAPSELRPRIQGGYVRGNGRGWRRIGLQKPRPNPKYYTTLSWLPKSNDPNIFSKAQECTLLTLDTLNKMLNLLGDKEDPSYVRKKKGSAAKTKKTDKVNANIDDNDTTSDASQVENKTESGVYKVRINVKSAVNGPRTYKPRKTTEMEAIFTPRRRRKGLYCCWCRQRMLQKIVAGRHIPKHGCQEGHCVCCCRKLLESYIMQDEKLKSAQQEKKNLSMTECAEAASACANLTKDIPWNVDNRVGPAVTKVAATQISLPPATFHSGVQTDIPLHENASVLGSEVLGTSTQETATSAVTMLPIAESASALPVVQNASAVPVVQNASAVPVVQNASALPVVQNASAVPVVQNASAFENPSVAVQTFDPVVKPIIEAHPVSPSTSDSNSKIKLVPRWKPFYKIDNQPTPPKSDKPFKPPKFLKEKLIFLNSKNISEKPSVNPIYLGKNKVLMTTVKFPWNLKLFEETKRALASTLKVPDGISLVCLPDGTISYSIDTAHVKALDLALMPSIIATVEMHMNNALLQQQPPSKLHGQPTVNPSEVIDLVDDEDEDNNKTENEVGPNNSDNTNEIEKGVTLTETTTCVQDSASESNQEEVSVTSETQLVQSDMTTTDISQSQEVTIEKGSVQSDPANLTSESQHEPQLIENVSSKMSTEDQNKLGPASQAESTEAAQILQIAAGQPEETENKGEQDVSVGQDIGQAQTGPSSQVDSIAVTQESHTDLGQSNQTNGNADQETTLSEVQSQPDLTQTPSTENTVDAEQPKKSKNILSDLMEMSGIFEDDVTPAPQEVLPIPPSQPVVPPSILSQLAAAAAEPAGASKLQGALLTPAANHLLSCPPTVKTPVGELSPVTSLYELKYAYKNRGIFFKLDFDTGYIVPINVCLKGPAKQRPSFIQPISQKAVIDLTDEEKLDGSEPNSRRKQSLLIQNNKITVTAGGGRNCKPLRFLKIAPSILRRNHADNKSEGNIKMIQVRTGKFARSKQKRKQHLEQYNFRENDEDMFQITCRKATKRNKSTDSEEPCASTSTQENDVTAVYDSSDDEPLSKVAKLKRQVEKKKMARIVIDLPEDEQIDDVFDLELDRNLTEIDQPPSSDEENCILGV